MATYSGAIVLAVSKLNVGITSNNGTILANQVVFTATKKCFVELNSFYNNLSAGVTLSVALQVKNPQGNFWATLTQFDYTGNTIGGSPTPAFLASAQKQALINSGRSASDHNGSAGDGNSRILLMPDDRLVVTGGSCADGSSLRIAGHLEELSSLF